MKRVTASDHTSSGIEKALEKGLAKYMVDSICCKDITIPPGNQSLVEDRFLMEKFQTE